MRPGRAGIVIRSVNGQHPPIVFHDARASLNGVELEVAGVEVRTDAGGRAAAVVRVDALPTRPIEVSFTVEYADAEPFEALFG